MEIFETAAYVARYWFLVVIGAVLVMTALASFSEYREKRGALDYAHKLAGFAEVTYAPSAEVRGERAALVAVTTIGRDGGCDLVVDAPRVRKKHLRLFCREDGVYAVAFSGCRAYLNGERLTAATQVFDGDILLIGDAQVTVHLKEGGA